MNGSRDRSPVFVFGALRSGTTVFRLMLNAHDRVGNPGEMDFLFDFLHRGAAGWHYDRSGLETNRIFAASGLNLPDDKDGLDLLDDFLDQLEARQKGRQLCITLHRNIAKVAKVLPKARIIHMLRDPRDVARSSIGMGWAGTLYHGVGHWIETEREWSDTMFPTDQVLTLTYEGLFRDIRHELSRVCDFLGAEFSDEMLGYHHDTTYGPPDPALVEQWKRKAHPRDIALVEGLAQDLMEARGYALAGTPATPALPERLGLSWRNRRHVWRTGFERYGAPVFLGEKLTRHLRLRRLHTRLRQRMNRLSVDYLK